MKKQNFVAARKIMLALTFAAMLAVPVIISRAQSGGGILDVLEQAKIAQAQQVEGSWTLTITPALPPGAPPVPSFHVYQTLARGGALIGSDRTRPFSSPQHGTWVHLGGNDFAATLTQDDFDAQGNFQGTLTVQQRFTVTGKDSFVAVASGELRNAAGVLVMPLCATVRGERIKVGSLGPLCQGITPPQ